MEYKDQLTMAAMNLEASATNFFYIVSLCEPPVDDEALEFVNRKFCEMNKNAESTFNLMPSLFGCPTLTLMVRSIVSQSQRIKGFTLGDLCNLSDQLVLDAANFLKDLESFSLAQIINEIKALPEEAKPATDMGVAYDRVTMAMLRNWTGIEDNRTLKRHFPEHIKPPEQGGSGKNWSCTLAEAREILSNVANDATSDEVKRNAASALESLPKVH